MQGPSSHFFNPEKSLRNKGNFTCWAFHLKDKGKGNTQKETSLDEKKREMKMNEDEDEDFNEREIKKGKNTQQLLSWFVN